MIIVDTSVWIDHFRAGSAELSRLLENGEVLQHPFVTGELALGNPADRRSLVALLGSLPQAAVAEAGDLHAFIDEVNLGGTGIGLVDAHLLLASQRQNAMLWSRDKRLSAHAERMGLSA